MLARSLKTTDDNPEKYDFRKGDKLSKGEVETFLTDYAKAQNLQHPNRLYVQLDGAFGEAVLSPEEQGELEYIKCTELMER